ELRSLSSQGFEVKDLGQRNLKGLENPEYIYLMYPHSLAARLVVQQQQQAQAEQAKAAAAAAPSNGNVGIESASGMAAVKSADSQLTIDTEHVWDLWSVSLRLEMLCSSLEITGLTALKAPETALLERMKQRGGEMTDRFVINFIEHQISRIETCVTTLALRHMVQPFRPGILSNSKPMAEILGEVTAAMSELKRLKGEVDMNDA
ncbi:adenylate cyclase protein, partial [Aureobasidium melanogenum]